MDGRCSALPGQFHRLLLVVCVCVTAAGTEGAVSAADKRALVTVVVEIPANYGAALTGCGNNVVFSHPWDRAPGDATQYPDLPGGKVSGGWFEDRVAGGLSEKWVVRLKKKPEGEDVQYMAVNWETKRLFLTQDVEKAAVWSVEWHKGDGLRPVVVHNGDRYVIEVDPSSLTRYDNPRICTYDAVVTNEPGAKGVVFHRGAP